MLSENLTILSSRLISVKHLIFACEMIAEDHHPDRDQGATQEAGRGPGEDLPQGLEASLGHTQDLDHVVVIQKASRKIREKVVREAGQKIPEKDL